MQQLAVEPGGDTVVRTAQPDGAADDRIEDGLNVRRRAADDLEDVRSRGLLFKRLFRLVEQAHVLDGDHGLVGEGLEQFDLMIAEWSRLGSATLIVPNATPSRSKGTQRMLR